MRVTRVLCAVDGSEGAGRALDYAALVARACGATLTIFHAIDAAPSLDDSRAQVRAFAAPHLGGAEAAIDARIGDVVPEIFSAVDRHGADLLVLGTHGRRGFDRVVLGSVTESVIRKATCPVLTVPPHAPPPPPHRTLSTIVAATDFAESSTRALRAAAGLAAGLHAQLAVVHVIEQGPEAGTDWCHCGDHARHVNTRVHAQLDAALPALPAGHPPAIAHVVEGKAHRGLLQTAERLDADLIVMGVHGRGPVDLLLFGSTTHHVIRAAHCPVLTVR